TVAQFNFSVGAPRRKRWNPETSKRHAVSEIERADFRIDPQTNDVSGDSRREIQADTELFVLNRHDLGGALDDWHWNFTASEKAGFAAVIRNQVGFGQALKQSPRLESFHQGSNVVFRVKDKQVHEVAECERAIWLKVRGRKLLCRRPGNRGFTL